MNQRFSTVIFLTLILLVILGTGVFLFLNLRTNKISETLASEETLRVLVVTHDEERPFLAFLLFYNGDTKQVAILDIPADVGGLMRPLGRVDEIAATFTSDAPDDFVRQVEALTGLPIPYKLFFTANGLRDFIDLLGGLDMFVITDYRELTPNNPILFPSGDVHFDGQKALQYLRINIEGEAKTEEIGRRQSFLHALLRTVQEQSEFLLHPDVLPIRQRFYTANFGVRAQNALFAALGVFNAERLVQRRVQGTYRTVSVENQRKILLFPYFEGQWLKQSVRQIEKSLATPGETIDDSAVIAIEVLNGTVTTGLARRTAELYEDYGFEVVRFGNAASNRVERTIVLDRSGRGDAAQRTARVIGAARVITEAQPDSDVDVTLILGGDFDGAVVRNLDE